MTSPPFPVYATMRNKIKDLTTRLLIKNGYQGFRFRDVAEPLQSTRANIHYYFGNKEKLVNEVVCEYMANTIERMAEGWKDPNKSLEDKIRWMMESNRQRYLQSNPTGQTAHPWSLIARMRLERDHIGEDARKATLGFSEDLERLVRNGIMAPLPKANWSPKHRLTMSHYSLSPLPTAPIRSRRMMAASTVSKSFIWLSPVSSPMLTGTNTPYREHHEP